MKAKPSKSETTTPKASKPPRTRSPNYPSLDLKTAVSKLLPLFNGMKRHSVGVEVAVGLMGHKYTSSSGKLALAAMRAFGFFDNERGQTDSLVKLSQLALDIVTDYPADSPHWLASVKKAALLPNIHADLWKKYGDSLPPDDEVRRYLVRELKFNDNAISPFIAEYKATIAFSKLASGDTIANEDEDEGEGDEMEATLEKPDANHRGGKSALLQKPPGTRDFPLYTSGGKGALYVPDRMSQKDYNLLKKQIENSLAVIEATAVGDD